MSDVHVIFKLVGERVQVHFDNELLTFNFEHPVLVLHNYIISYCIDTKLKIIQRPSELPDSNLACQMVIRQDAFCYPVLFG